MVILNDVIPDKKYLFIVNYFIVDKKVDEIWKLKPYLVVHCGGCK